MIDQLATAIGEAAGSGSGATATCVPRQTVVRYDDDVSDLDMSYGVFLCVVAQGAKVPGDGEHPRVEAGKLLLNWTPLPVTAVLRVPYRSVSLRIDRERVARSLEFAALNREDDNSVEAPNVVAPASHSLLDAVYRWVRLSTAPQDAAALAQNYEDEILYRVLQSPAGGALRRAALRGDSDPILQALRHIADNFDNPRLRIEDLSYAAALSQTALHQRFRDHTGMTPSKYIKKVRLQRGRQLMATGWTASAAASRVGYVSAAHFSRDYTAQYGMPPRRHASSLIGAR